MEYSKHNIFSRVRGREQWYLLGGHADLLEKVVATAVASGSPPPAAFADAFTKNGYWVTPAEDQQRYDKACARSKAAEAGEEIQRFLLSDASSVTMVPNTAGFGEARLKDAWGHFKTDRDMQTSLPDMYAVGDLRSKRIRQLTTVVGDGTIAAVVISQ